MSTAVQPRFINLFHDDRTVRKSPDAKIQTLAQKILQNLRAGHAFHQKSECARDISAISIDQLNVLMKTVITEMASSDLPIKTLEGLAEIIPLDRLQAAIRLDYPQHIDALQTAKEMLKEAQIALRAAQGSRSPSFRYRLNELGNSLISLIETVLAAYGIRDLFKPSENRFDDERKNYKITGLITTTEMFISLLGAVLGSALIGWTFGMIAIAITIF